MNFTAQRRREVHAHSAPRSAIPNTAIGDLDVEHLFEAQRLSAELKVGGGPVTRARLVFDGSNYSCLDLHGIRAT